MLNHALYYAKLGYPVLPIHTLIERQDNVQCSCILGASCDKPGKHPRTRFGHQEATTDEQTIRNWWNKFSTSNIGILTGSRTGIFVLDIDVKHGGELSLEYMQEDYKAFLQDNYNALPGTLTTITGSGGRHLYFKYPNNTNIKGSASVIGCGLDIRGEDNYIIAPPSKHISGNHYSWFGFNTPVEESPDWLIYEILKAGKENRASLATSSKSIPLQAKYTEKVNAGRRNFNLMSYICGLVNSFSEEEVLRRALEHNNNYLNPPLPQKRVESTVSWAWKKYGTNSKRRRFKPTK